VRNSRAVPSPCCTFISDDQRQCCNAFCSSPFAQMQEKFSRGALSVLHLQVADGRGRGTGRVFVELRVSEGMGHLSTATEY